MNAINSEAKFAVVYAAVGNAFDCDTFHSSESGRTPAYVVASRKCYSQTASMASSTCDSVGNAAGEGVHRRLCCCTSAGDDSSAMCPVQAADCDTAGLVWNGQGLCDKSGTAAEILAMAVDATNFDANNGPGPPGAAKRP